jgi:pyridoxal phosphate enzyme (YggS family)
MGDLAEKFHLITEKIRSTLTRVGRSQDSAKLLAVSKGQSLESIRELQGLGQSQFGENYFQEWKSKKENLKGLHWHFTGSLQTNKVKDLVGEIDYFHSIDRLKLAQALEHYSEKLNLTSRGFLEVSLAEEETKGGIREEKLEELLGQLNSLSHLEIVGLMALPPFFENPEDSRSHFKRLREILFDLNRKNIYRLPLNELSMGMSHDFIVALEEGATWVRIGTALFGERHKKVEG